MSEYKSNSFKSKEEARRQERNIRKGIGGEVTVREETLWSKLLHIFIAGDMSDLKGMIIDEVLIPAGRKALSDIWKKSGDVLFHGRVSSDEGPRQRGNRPSYSYSAYYDDQRRDNAPRNPDRRPSDDWNRVTFSERGFAEEVLEEMRMCIREYGNVSVLEFYDISGVSVYHQGQYTNNNYGWTDLDNAYVERTAEGFSIHFPKPRPIN